MSKKLLAGLASVVAVAAFIVMPTAAQAAPHYYVNGTKLKEGTAFAKTSLAWGTVTLRGTFGTPPGAHVICHSVSAGTLFNPTGEGAGEGQTEVSASFSCEQESVCPTGTTSVQVIASKLPWRNLLTEEEVGTIRQETTGGSGVLECFNAKGEETAFPFSQSEEKGLRPKGVEGTEALHPGVLEFDAKSGEYSTLFVKFKPEGALKTLGYNAQELIGVKNP